MLVVGQKLNAAGQPLYFVQATLNDEPQLDADGLPLFQVDAAGHRVETTVATDFPVLLENPSRDNAAAFFLGKLGDTCDVARLLGNLQGVQCRAPAGGLFDAADVADQVQQAASPFNLHPYRARRAIRPGNWFAGPCGRDFR